ncbi:aquaporin-8-like [Diadema antillarum]|uniref:aquaporin-8-like n=1 Tax=Diadema antillarum TaxID=105358 RepID=UPI003A8813A1
MSGSVKKPPKDSLQPRDTRVEEEDENLWESIVQPAFAEFAGTFFYTFAVCMAVTTQNTLLYAIACGLGIGCLCVAFVNISGGHFNPATTLATFISGGLHIVNLLCYIPLQIIGAIIGAAFVRACLYEPTYSEIKGGASVFRGNHRIDGFNEWMMVNNWDTEPFLGIITEVIMSFMVFAAYLQANIDERRSGKRKEPLVYGLAITCVTLASFYTAGAGFNPAVSFGAAIVSEQWADHYVYWAGPLAGAGIAALFFRIILGDEEKRLLC